MAVLVEWNTVGEIFVESAAAGIVIVGAVALGARLVATTTGRSAGGTAHRPRKAPALVVATICFLVAAAAVGYGVYFTIDK
jgi:hypothetical protein